MKQPKAARMVDPYQKCIHFGRSMLTEIVERSKREQCSLASFVRRCVLFYLTHHREGQNVDSGTGASNQPSNNN
jgi:predicted DNA-binding ribbon-helix-helix protein